ncbi:MAG: phosphate ABC transporter substrate-binding protein PstS [Synechococcales bacterium]|nr:phosphate ABC transporter substrate-binding protein PstS [Synechococcales bacterium]
MSRRLFPRWFFGAIAIIALWIVACQSSPPVATDSDSPGGSEPTAIVRLNGTGASFPFFIYQRWFAEYNQLHPNVQINYQPTGSEVGVQQIISGTIDFGASDVAMSEADQALVEPGVVLLPMTAGSVAIAYNLPGIESGLKLPRSVYPAIFTGEITSWSDPQIAAANPDLALPDLPIILVHRSDGSGTTAALTNHLSAISPTWKDTIGAGVSVSWPAGVAIKSNAGVSAQIQQAAGAIGYVEYSYTQQLGMAVAALENRAGEFVLPSVAATASALGTVELPESLVAFVPDPEGAESYPISTYTWILAYQRYDDPAKAETLRQVLQWCATEGQQFSEELGYVPLPEDVTSRVVEAIAQIQ